MTLRMDVRPTILLVDDAPENLATLGALLSDDYRVRVARSGFDALSSIEDGVPDLILLDIVMPQLDGFEVLRLLRQREKTKDTPVIFVSARSGPYDEEFGLALGAADYVTKPFQPAVVRARVRTQLLAKQARDGLRGENLNLSGELRRRVEENDTIQQAGLLALAHLAETRDPETGNHLLRTQAYVSMLAQQLSLAPGFATALSAEYRRLLVRSAPLHDIGKVGIPDAVLLKPGKLTAEEFEVMKTHSVLGARALERAEQESIAPVAFLSVAKQVARWHHERWDGSGYPDGLAGEAIPLCARIMAVADVFDALVSRRVYKEAMPVAHAVEVILAGRGTQFDPAVTDVFETLIDRFIEVARHFADDPSAP